MTLTQFQQAFAIAGIFIGNNLSRRINGAALKKGFGWFVLVMGTYILAERIITLLK